MPKIDISKANIRTTSGYPAPLKDAVLGREKAALGNLAGLTQFGINLTRLKPGAASALRHWHDNEDEFVYVLEGELTLIEDEGETLLRPGDAAGFKAGVPNGHHLVNRSEEPCTFVAISAGPRTGGGYSDIDMVFTDDGRFCRRDGTEYPKRV